MTAIPRPETVVHALLDSVRRTPDRPAFHVIERSEEEFTLSYAETFRLLGRAAAGLRAQGIGQGDRVIIVLPTSRDFLSVYLGCLYCGIVPVIAAEPMDGRTEHYAANLRRLAERARAELVVAGPDLAKSLAPLLPATVITPDALRKAPFTLDSPRATPGSPAHLQATSGSTGAPKLAVIRHGNIVANVQAIAEAIEGNPDDSLVSWLPLFHDMGLIGISYALCARIPVVLSDPVNFLRSPLS